MQTTVEQKSGVGGHAALLARGIAGAAQRLGWARAAGGFQIPYWDTEGKRLASRYWRDGGNRTWGSAGKHPRAGLYHAPDVKARIAQAGGSAYLVEGETSGATLEAAGIRNWLALFGASGTAPLTAEYCAALGLTSLIAIPDNDTAGRKAILRIQSQLQGSEVALRALDVSGATGDKGDLNDVWRVVVAIEGVTADVRNRFRRFVGNLPTLELPQPAPVPVRRRETGRAASHEEFRQEDIARDIAAHLHLFGTPVDSGGWYRQRIACPIHGGQKKQARVSATTGNLTCFTECAGVVAWDVVADKLLGREWRKRYAPPAPAPEVQPAFGAQWVAFDNLPAAVLEEKYLGDALKRQQGSTARLLAVRSPMGSGKTTALHDLVRQLPEGARALIITPYRSLCWQLADRFGFALYDRLTPAEVREAQRLVICNVSLWKVTGISYDLVIADEIDHVLDQFTQTELMAGRMPLDWSRALGSVLSLAQRAIVTSAHLTRFDVRLLRDLAGFSDGDMAVIDNRGLLSPTPLARYEHNGRILQDAIETIAARPGAPVLIFCGSALTAKTLRQWLEQAGFAGETFHKGNSRTARGRELSANIDMIASKDFLIYTTALSTGIDYTGECAAVYGIFDNPGLAPTVAMQALFRARHARRYAYWIAAAQSAMPDIKQQVDDLLRFSSRVTRQRNLALVDDDALDMAADPRALLTHNEIHSQRLALMNIARYHFAPIFAELARLQGFVIEAVSAAADTTFVGQFQDLREQMRAADVETIKSIAPLSKASHRSKEKLNQLVEADALARERDRIGNAATWDSSRLPDNIYAAFHSKDLRIAFYRFCDVYAERDAVWIDDAVERDFALHTRRAASKFVAVVMGVLTVATGYDDIGAIVATLHPPQYLEGEQATARLDKWRATPEGEALMASALALRIIDRVSCKSDTVFRRASRAIGMKVKSVKHWLRDDRRGKQNWTWDTDLLAVLAEAYSRWLAAREAEASADDDAGSGVELDLL